MKLEIKKEEREEVCAICLEKIKRGQIAGYLADDICEHEFHGTCLSAWFNICKSCPLCRSGQASN